VLLRVFCHAYGAKVVLLLNGYDKAADPRDRRQQREIAPPQAVDASLGGTRPLSPRTALAGICI
jgi:hypothetical protein